MTSTTSYHLHRPEANHKGNHFTIKNATDHVTEGHSIETLNSSSPYKSQVVKNRIIFKSQPREDNRNLNHRVETHSNQFAKEIAQEVKMRIVKSIFVFSSKYGNENLVSHNVRE
jgi:hypothetical protein